MSRRGFLGIEMEFDLFQPEACPADHVFNIPRMKGPRREEALARFEVAATQKKAKLIGGRTQVRVGLRISVLLFKAIFPCTIDDWLGVP